MKKLFLVVVICICGLMSQTSYAQISIRANISLQPIWGPVGYDYVDYYYLPDVEAYYYVPTHMFFYMENGRWINRPYLSGRYRNFDLYNARKYVINEPRPYLHHQIYRTRYANARGYNRPMLIRDSHDSRYFEIKDHPEHSKWNNGRGNVKDQRVMDNRNNQYRNQNMNQNRNDNRNQYQKDNRNQNQNQKDNRNQNQNKNDNRNQNQNKNDNRNQNQNQEQGPGRDHK